MSVIVKGIDMPENCLDYCPMFRHGTGNYTYCVIGKSKPSAIKRPDDCQLKSVDGLVERINKLAYSETEYGIEEFDASKIVRLDDLIEVIKKYCGMEDTE